MTCPRILVTGDRDWPDQGYDGVIYQTLERLIDPNCPHSTTMIEGAAKGADTQAYRAAIRIGALRLRFPADWIREGKAAGPTRNIRMLELGKPHIVLSFHDHLWSTSKGTLHMVRLAARNQIPTFHFNSKGGDAYEVVHDTNAANKYGQKNYRDGAPVSVAHIRDVLDCIVREDRTRTSARPAYY